MKILELIDTKTLIITSNSYKEYLLEEMSKTNKLYNIKFMSLEEYKKNYLFDYDEKTIYYLYHKYNMKVDNVITLLNNLYYIDNKDYFSDKLNYLVKIKKELDDNNLLIYNDLFKEYLKSFKVIVYNYYELDKYSLSLFNNALFINDQIMENKHFIYKFDDISNEVEFIFNSIADLLNKGVDINHIKIIKPSSEYIPYLKRFSSFYSIPISFNENKVYGTNIVSLFLSWIRDGLSNKDILEKLSIYKDTDIYNMLIKLLNKYISFDNLLDVYDLLVYDLKNMSISKKYINTISFISLNDYISDNDYVFLLGFNNGYLPNLYKDEEYISDNIKKEIIMSDTDELNRISNNNTINNIKRIKILTISYKLKTPFNTYFPSNLIDNLNYEVLDYNQSYHYSLRYNKLKYAMLLDNYLKYGEYNNDLGILHYNYGNISYKNYDNAYNVINNDKLLEYLENKLTLSYSSIDNYYKCAFRYYLNNILKVELYEETFNTIIGNIFHYVLSKAFLPDFSFEREFNYSISAYQFTNREQFFVNKLKQDLLFIIKTINEYRINTGLNNELYEKKFDIKLNDNPNINFKGFVDKIMFREKDNNTYMAIIDYKTGNPDIKLDYLKYGLSMQLASYLYLTSKSEIFKNIKYCGFYLQHILDNEIKIDRKKSLLDSKRDNLKLQGYSTNDKYRLELFDASYENSMMIHGMKVKKDGELSANSKVLDDEDINKIILLCEDKIKEASEDIIKAKFDINPKVIKGNNLGCLYCNFKDICYHKAKDNLYLEEGDNNAKLDD